MTQAQLLIQAYFMIIKSGVCPETKPEEWKNILIYLHTKGFLYAHVEGEKVDMVAAMYRVPKLTKKILNTYPKEEKGEILYVPFFVSTSENKALANQLFKSIIDKMGNIKEIAFHDLKGGAKLRRYKRIKKESNNVKQEVAVAA